jgi:hypothetical protein
MSDHYEPSEWRKAQEKANRAEAMLALALIGLALCVLVVALCAGFNADAFALKTVPSGF